MVDAWPLPEPVPTADMIVGGLICRRLSVVRHCGHQDTVPVYGASEAELQLGADVRLQLEQSNCDLCRVRH